MSDLITPELAKKLQGASPEVRLRAAELLEKAKEAEENREGTEHLYGVCEACVACIY